MATTGATLQELIVLNDEIAALVRAGVPLDQGLLGVACDVPGRLGRLSGQLAERVARGDSLADALDAEPQAYPEVYRAVVRAGLRSGRLAAALEAVAGSARRVMEARRMVAIGMLYPLLVLLVAWQLFVFYVLKLSPAFSKGFRDLGGSGAALVAWVSSWGSSVQIWGPLVPLAVGLVAAIWWFTSGRTGVLDSRRCDWLLGWLPWIGGMMRSFRTATFADVAALLADNGVPLDESLLLAAEAVGDPTLVRSAGELAESIRRGQPLDSRSMGHAGIHPVLAWMIAAGCDRGMLVESLRRAGEIYRRRAMGRAEIARMLLPVTLTVCLAGTATALYALLVFAPWISVLHALTQP
jgi:type II secretory pathway component PulF